MSHGMVERGVVSWKFWRDIWKSTLWIFHMSIEARARALDDVKHFSQSLHSYFGFSRCSAHFIAKFHPKSIHTQCEKPSVPCYCMPYVISAK